MGQDERGLRDLGWQDWRAVIAVLRDSGLPYKRDHADHIERLLEQHGPDEATVTLHLTENANGEVTANFENGRGVCL